MVRNLNLKDSSKSLVPLTLDTVSDWVTYYLCPKVPGHKCESKSPTKKSANGQECQRTGAKEPLIQYGRSLLC